MANKDTQELINKLRDEIQAIADDPDDSYTQRLKVKPLILQLAELIQSQHENITPWGTHYTPDIPYSQGWKCLGCDWELPFSPANWANYCIGFTKNVKKADVEFMSNIYKVGGLIFECPKCHEKFWFHADIKFVKRIMEDKDMTTS